MGLAFGGATLLSTVLLNNSGVRRLFGVPLAKPDPITASKPVAQYAAPRNPNAPVAVEKTGTQSIRAGFDSLIKSVKDQTSSVMPTTEQNAKAEKARKQRIQKAEAEAAAQREQDFINRYKK